MHIGSPAPAAVNAEVDVEGSQENPEDGWEDETWTIGTVLDFETGAKVDRRTSLLRNQVSISVQTDLGIAWTLKKINLRPGERQKWSFEKIFNTTVGKRGGDGARQRPRGKCGGGRRATGLISRSRLR